MLIWILLGAGLGYAGARVLLGYPPAHGFRILARPEVAFLTAAADAIYPDGAGLPSGPEARVAERLDAYLEIVPARMRRLMRLLFFLVEHATAVFPAPAPRGRRRFSSLSAEQRTAALDAWRTSRLFPRRLVFASLRALLTNAYVADPGVLRGLGLTPWAIDTPVCEADLLYPPIGQLPAAIRHAATSPPSDGTPLDPAAPRHPAYAEARP
jgi:hypothetical protein